MTDIEVAWNNIFTDFMDQMHELYPESPASSIKFKFQLNNYIGLKNPINMFLDKIEDHAEEIENENEDYFHKNKDNISFIKNFGLDEYYDRSSPENKKVIWKYIKTLYNLAKIHKANSS